MLHSRSLPVLLVAMGVALGHGQTITFGPATPYTSVSGPKATLLGDFSGDGIKDLGVLGNGFFVIPGIGNGTFSGLIFSSLGGPMVNAAAGDFNEDGKLDIVCADGASSIKVFTNTGGGNFLELASYPAGTGAKFLTVADVNGDSHLDVVVGYPSLAIGTYFRGNGNGSLVSGLNFAFSISGTVTSMTSGDFNADGRPDMAFSYNNMFSVAMWNGTSFNYSGSYSTSGVSGTIVAAKVDGDPFTDIVAASSSSQMSTHKSLGGGTFVFGTSSVVGGNGVAGTAADLNGDGRTDIITGSLGGPQIFHVQTNGTLLLGSAGVANVNAPPVHIATSDLNSDGRLDVVTTNTTGSVISVLLNSITTTINGHINFGDWLGLSSGHTVQLVLKSGTTTLQSATAFTNSLGNFTLTTTALGSFTLSAEVSHWLRKTIPVTVTNSGSSATFNLVNGDADLSGEVDAVDIDVVIANFGGTGPNNADLDGSFEVDAVDIDISIAHFGEVDN